MVPLVSGAVLEIGMGAGHNLPYYDTQRVSSVVGIDPCRTSWGLAQPRAQGLGVPLDFVEGSAEDMPLEDAQFDSVLMTFSLCTIPNAQAALAEIHRVLKPGGQLVFCEHGQAPDDTVVKWQNRINPLWRRLLGGCNLNRPILDWIKGSGFMLQSVDQMYLPGTPRIAGFNVWGTAQR